jgi:hypothetical protein
MTTNSTTYHDFGNPVIAAAWLNDVNTTVYTALGDGSLNPPATPAQVLANIGAVGAASPTFTGTVTVNGNETVSGTLGVTGNTTVGGTLGVTGATTLSSAGVTGNATVGGTFGVTGQTTLGAATGVTATLADNTTKLATTAFVLANSVSTASPAFTGTPTAPTASLGTNTTQLATTAFVENAIQTTAGFPIQMRTGTDSGKTTTSTTQVNLNNANIAFTPLSTNSTIIIDVQGAFGISNVSSTNTTASFQIYDGATALGTVYTLSASSSTGGTGNQAPGTVRAIISNASLTARSFALHGFQLTGAGGPATASATNLNFVITEIHN